MIAESKEWESRLEWSVRALAQPKVVQEALFPEFVCLADELALDFEESLRGFQAGSAQLGERFSEAVLRLDAQLEKMSGPKNAEMWTDEALADSPEWATVRELAVAVAEIAGWPTSSPGPSKHVYVDGHLGLDQVPTTTFHWRGNFWRAAR